MTRARLWTALVLAYVAVRLLVRLTTAGAYINTPLVAEIVIVPVAQIIAFEVLAAAFGWRPWKDAD